MNIYGENLRKPPTKRTHERILLCVVTAIYGTTGIILDMGVMTTILLVALSGTSLYLNIMIWKNDKVQTVMFLVQLLGVAPARSVVMGWWTTGQLSLDWTILTLVVLGIWVHKVATLPHDATSVFYKEPKK